MKTHAAIIGDERVTTDETATVVNPFTGKGFAKASLCGKKEINQAIKAAQNAFKETRDMSSYATSSLLKRAVHGIIRNRKKLVDSIINEAGKPAPLAEQEVDRTITTFNLAAEEAGRMGGEYLPVDIDNRSEGCFAITKRFPVGVVAGISPFNFPLNLVAHKVAPAIASRNTIVLKPATKTPITALLLGEILLEAGMTPGQYNVVPCRAGIGEQLVTDERIAKLTFTGSPAVGWRLKSIAGKKKITLELGGNAAAVVHSDADLDWAVPRIVGGAFGYAGQTCISVQRILIHKPIFEKTKRALVNEIKRSVKAGDPRKKGIMVGPMIDPGALKQTAQWVKEAEAAGAKILCGGRKKGTCYEPTLLTNVKKDMNVVCQEVFAPVATLQSYSTFSQALKMVNDSAFGLQVGVFTRDLDHAFETFETADVGGVIINDFPTFRVDNMPYGGVKMSGFGREGVRYAIEEMTEQKVMVVRR